MPRDLPLANGTLLVNFDNSYNLRDVYYPHVGQENHTLGYPSRVGVWVDGDFAWLSDWPLALCYQHDTLVTDVHGSHPRLGLRIEISDAVDCERNVLMRRFVVTDESGRDRQVRLFVHFNPSISESEQGNGALYDPGQGALICYKGDRYFLMSSTPSPSEYAVGQKGSEQWRGTWVDAEDGTLSNNSVAHGSVDATLSCVLAIPAWGAATAHVWLAAGQSLDEVVAIHRVVASAPGTLLDRTTSYWRFWLDRARRDFGDLSPAVADLFRRSLLVIRTQIDSNGAIIAANDSDVTSFGQDSYSYVWPRDAALVAEALDLAGYHDAPRQFYRFLRQMLAQPNYALNGYLLHRYTPTGLAAATWHPGVTNGGLSLPIQEDETALVVYGLCSHLELSGDVEVVRDLYWKFVRPAADFMLIYRDPLTSLPQPSHDLWEEKHGVFLFTCSTVAAALRAAGALAQRMGDEGPAASYRAAADEVRDAVASHLYDPSLGRFVFMLHVDAEGRILERDPLLDSSMAGVFEFDLFPAQDPRVAATMQALERGLRNRTSIGGIARHGDDYYYHLSGKYTDYPGNTWFVSTLWLADWLTAVGDRKSAREWLEWCAARALPSGVLAEQLHPTSGAPISATPLTWSHAAFVASVERYLRAL